MTREAIIEELDEQLLRLTQLHIQHRLDHTEQFQQRKSDIVRMIRQHGIDVRHELSPLSRNLYRRYFD